MSERGCRASDRRAEGRKRRAAALLHLSPSPQNVRTPLVTPPLATHKLTNSQVQPLLLC